MDDADVEQFVARVYSAMKNGELSGLESQMDAEVEFVNPGYALEAGVRRGPDAVLKVMTGLLEIFEYSRIDVAEVEHHGDRALVIADVAARGKDSGALIETRAAHLFTFRGEKLLRFHWFWDVEEAREALASE